jgi:hypothetical protein
MPCIRTLLKSFSSRILKDKKSMLAVFKIFDLLALARTSKSNILKA